MLKGVKMLSVPGGLLLTWAEVYSVDLSMATAANNPTESLDHYSKAHQQVLQQVRVKC